MAPLSLMDSVLTNCLLSARILVGSSRLRLRPVTNSLAWLVGGHGRCSFAVLCSRSCHPSLASSNTLVLRCLPFGLRYVGSFPFCWVWPLCCACPSFRLCCLWLWLWTLRSPLLGLLPSSLLNLRWHRWQRWFPHAWTSRTPLPLHPQRTCHRLSLLAPHHPSRPPFPVISICRGQSRPFCLRSPV